MMIAVCLLLLTVLTIFSVIFGGTFMGSLADNYVSDTVVINGTSSTFVIEGQDWVFSIDPITGFVATILVVVTIVTVLGLNVIGTGLNDASVRIATLGIVYSSIWATLSLLAYPLIASIEVFGGIIYVVLTIAYAVGVIQKIDGEPS